MKNLFLTVSILLATTLTAQSGFKVVEEKEKPVEIGKVKIAGVWYASDNLNVEDSSHTIYYRDVKYAHITKVESFSLQKEDYDQLVNEVPELLIKRKDLEMKIALADGTELTIRIHKSGKIQFSVWNKVHWSYCAWLNLRNFNKLVGNLNR